MKSPTVFRLIWLLGGLAMLLGFARDPILALLPIARELPRFDGAIGRPWVEGGFDHGSRTPEVGAGTLPPQIQNVTSWVGTDEWQGRAESAWFKANRWFIHVAVKGYPQHPGCKIWAEFRTADDTVTRVDCPLINPREEWDVWEIRRPADAIAVRIVGEDRSSANAGWIAFSHPFRAWPGIVTACYQFLQLATTGALALTLIWGPGLLGCPRRAAPEIRLAIRLGAGPLLLAAFGIVIWVLSAWLPPQVLGLVLVAGLWAVLGGYASRRRFTWEVGPGETRVLALTALIVVAVIAKSTYSVGPQGELFQGTVSRNMEMSDRIDSRFSFYVVQAAAHHWGPASPKTEGFFRPWTFFSRGPLAGLATTPIVLATNGRPPEVLPESRWSPYDPSGFAAFRVTMITLASSVIVALFLMMAPLVGERWALVAAGLLALSPFGVHEVMFTWPKWEATAWLIASFALAHARRPGGAGFALALGFLFHPLTLLWAPWIGLWAAGRTSDRRAGPVAIVLIRFGLGAGALVLPWMALGAVMPHLPTAVLAGQGGFLRYWARADWQYATWATWWQTRWMNFANTFVPLHLYLSDASFHHPKLSSAYETSGPLVRFAHVWWNSLPFALGLGLWGLSVVATMRALRRLRAAVWLFAFLPALLIIGYWGMDPLGLMRECGHPLFVGVIAITCVIAARNSPAAPSVLLHPAVPWLQLPETWLMLWLTTLVNPKPWAVEFKQLDALYLTINTLALLAAAWVLSRRRGAVTAGA